MILEGITKTLDPTAQTVTIDDNGNWTGPGALIINTDDGDTIEQDDDFNYDETVAYRLWESQDQLQLNNDEREKRWGLNPWKANVFTAYDFDEGFLRGFTVGGGYRYLGGTIIGEDSSGNEIQGPSQSYFDLLLRYAVRLKMGIVSNTRLMSTTCSTEQTHFLSVMSVLAIRHSHYHAPG